MGQNHFGHGPRDEPGLAEQVRLVLARNTELGHRKKKKMGRWNCTGANQRAG
jgi:hypothetical protein